MFLYSSAISNPVPYKKYAKLLVVAVALIIVTVMIVSSFSGAVYYPSASSQSKSGGSHVYLVTTRVGGLNTSYYEKVQSGKVVKTWPASAVPQTTNLNLSKSGLSAPSNLAQNSKYLQSQLNVPSSPGSNASAISTNQSNITSLDQASTGSTFNLTQSYTLTSITLSPTSSSLYIGQSINFQGSWMGGASPFTYLWQVFLSHDNHHNLTYYTGSTTGNGASFSFAPDHSGTYKILLTVNGTGTGAGLNATSIITVTNNQNGDRHGNDQGSQNYQTGLQSVTLSPTTSVMYTGQPITFVGNWTGSFNAYNYAWEITNSPINWKSYYKEEFNQINSFNTTHATSADFTFNPIYSSYGIYYLYLYLTPTDSNGHNNQKDFLVGYSQIILLPGTPGVTSVTISPSSVNADSDSGVPITFTGNWSGGTAGYSYAWMVVKKEPISTPYILQLNSYNYTNGNSATFSYAPSDNGQYYVYLFVNSASSSAWVMAVSQIYSRESHQPSVTQVTLTPTTVSADLGEQLTFYANWTGGASPYTYAWYVTSNFPYWQQDHHSFSSENTTSLPKANFTYIPSSYGIYYLYLFVKDQNHKLAPVATAEIIVLHPSLPLTTSAISISPTTATVGTPLYATVESGYGIAPFSYSWTVSTSSGQPVPSGYSTSGNQITFSTSGTYDVTVTVTDSSGVSVSFTETVTINALLSATVAVYGFSNIDEGQSTTLTAVSINGGIPPYTGQWLEEPPNFASYVDLGNSFPATSNDLSASIISTGTLSTTGTWLFELKVTDSSSTVAYSTPISVTVSPQLSVALSSPVTQIDSGNSVTFTNQTQGGTSPFAYSYTVSPTSGWTQSTNPGNTFTFTMPNTYTVTLTVTDAAGASSTSYVTVTVVSPPLISEQPQSYSIDPDQQFTIPLTSMVEYGSGSFTWQWYTGTTNSGTPISDASGSGTTATFTPVQAGSYYVVFKDSTGQSVTSDVAVITMNSAPSVSVSPSSATIYESQSLPLTTTSQGGSGQFSYSWTLGGSKSILGTGTSYTFSESTIGTYTIWLNVTDTGTSPNYALSPISISITVNAAPSVTISPSTATIDSSQSVLLTPTVSGGSGSYIYSWTIGGSSTLVGTSSTYSFSETTPGTYKVWLNVTDTGTTLHLVITASVLIVVDSNPSITVQPQSATIDSGQSIVVTSTATGGTGSFTWQWYDSSGPITGASGTGPTATYTLSSVDTGVYVTFTDSGTTSGSTPAATASSGKISVTVDPALSILTEPSSGTIDSGQVISLSSTVTGGTGQYSWSLYTSSNTFVASGTGPTASYPVSPAATNSYYFKFTDTGVAQAASPAAKLNSATVAITVDPALTVSISPSSATVPLGQSQVFTSTTSGGSGKFSYSWTLGGSSNPVSVSNSYDFIESTVGSYTIWLNVTDTGTTLPYTISATVTVQVHTATLSVSFSYNTPSSGSGYLDLGESVTLSVTPTISGGISPYSYQWYLNGTSSTSTLGKSGGAVSGTVITNSFTPAGKGTYVFYLTISSSDGLLSTSGPITVTVYAAPSISIQPVSTMIDLGKSITLTSAITGGSSSFSWSLYTASGTLVSSGIGKTPSYKFSPQSNNTYYFSFTDTGVISGSNPTPTAKSSNAVITVNSDPSVTVLPVTIGSGKSATLTATAAGGSRTGYSFKWYSDSGLSNLVYSGNPFATPSLSITTTYYVTVVDSTGFVSTPASVVVTVVGSLTSSSITITPTTTDVGYPILASVSTGSGVSPYSYSWTITLYPSGSASGDYTTSGNGATFNTAGVYSATVTVKDSAGEIASLSKTITVNNIPSVTISPSTVSIDAGNSVTFSNTTSGGTGPMTYSWGYPGSAGITQSGNTFTFQNTGSFTVKLYFNDSLGASGFASSAVTVNTQPVIVYSSLNVTVSAPPIMDSGTATNIVITAVSGTGPYTAQLKEESPGSTTYSVVATTNQFSTLPENINTGTLTAIGQWHFVVTVTEVSNTGIFGTSSPITVTVTNPPASSAISISPTTTEVGSPITATMQPGYGTSPFTYVWSVTLSGGSASGDYSASGNQVTFNTAGTYSATVTITDADGISASNVATITVNSQLSITISSITPTIIDKGQTVTFSNSVAGGLTPYTISYSVTSIGGGIKIGAYSVTGNVITFSLTGEYAVTSTVTDSLGKAVSSSNSITVTVNALPTVTLTASPASQTTIDTGNSVTFTNTTANGTQPYTYIWSYPSAQGITQSGNTFTFNNTGNFTITLTIVDAVGVVASSSVLITVNPSPIIVLQPGQSPNQQTSSQMMQGHQTLAQEQKKNLMPSKERQ